MSDRQIIVYGEWLTDTVIDAAQELLKERFPEIGGLQRTTLGQTLSYAVERGEFVQILNIRGNHWITTSSVGCSPNHLNIYDSIPDGDISSRAKLQIAALLCTGAKAITLKFPDVQIQHGLSDCGFVFYCICNNIMYWISQQKLSMIKENLEIISCSVFNADLTPFPCILLKK